MEKSVSFHKDVETHGAPFELASKVINLKASLAEKEKALEDVRTSLNNSKTAQETLTSEVSKVEDTLKGGRKG